METTGFETFTTNVMSREVLRVKESKMLGHLKGSLQLLCRFIQRELLVSPVWLIILTSTANDHKNYTHTKKNTKK